jgi:hypothetical protein
MTVQKNHIHSNLDTICFFNFLIRLIIFSIPTNDPGG